MIKAGIIGSTGYTGAELVRILTNHPQVQIKWFGSRTYLDQEYAQIYKNFFEIIDATCLDDNIEKLAEEVDVIFMATPQGYCASMMSEEILQKVKIIDLSADYRIKDVSVYEDWYGIEHKSPQFIDEAVYGLSEINREAIKEARLLANPGCYTTCSILSIYPLAKEGIIDLSTLIIDAKSGVTGAGRSAKLEGLYCEVNDSIKAYGVATHRHTPEIEEQLGLAAGEEFFLSFTPHLIPMNRGILISAYVNLKKELTEEEIREVYKKYYAEEKFIRLLNTEQTPETRWVKGSNFLDINIKLDSRSKRLVIMGAIDNLMKGASGQAVQNMNLMFGLEESMGLELIPCFP